MGMIKTIGVYQFGYREIFMNIDEIYKKLPRTPRSNLPKELRTQDKFKDPNRMRFNGMYTLIEEEEGDYILLWV